MPCFYPIDAWRVRDRLGNYSILFSPPSFSGCKSLMPNLQLPCGRCLGCRLERSRQWAVRIMHEAQMHDENCFITLTYDDKHLPKSMSLDKSDFQKFMKRLRKFFSPKKIRYFHAGEYGDLTLRPHYHAILFGLDMPDRAYYPVKREDGSYSHVYTSAILAQLWGAGHVAIGDVTFESAAYVARYIMKKITGQNAEAHYLGREPEYCTMSRRPGIGQKWLDKYMSDVYPHDYAVVRGFKSKPPRYYDKEYSKSNGDRMEELKNERMKKAKETDAYLLSILRPGRLKSKEIILNQRVTKLKRGIC